MALTGIFQTKRLTFWPFTEADFELMRSLDADPEVMRYIGTGAATEAETRTRFNRVLAQTKQYGVGVYAAHLRATGEFIGRAGLIHWELDGEKIWEVGYTFAKAHWGKGYATEAAQYWKQVGFERLDVPFLVSLIHPENLGSIKVAEKNGMTLWKRSKLQGQDVCVYRCERPKAKG